MLSVDAAPTPASGRFPPSLLSRLPGLRRLEEQLRCHVCYELPDTPVLTACSHHFCSVCVRRYLLHKSQCPQCHEQLYEADLRPNRVLQEALAILLGSVLPDIESRLDHDGSRDGDHPRPKPPRHRPPVPSSPAGADADADAGVKTRVRSRSRSGENGRVADADDDDDHDQEIASQSLPATQPLSLPTVPCPVCQVQLPEKSINQHLDRCLQGAPAPPASQPRLSTSFLPVATIVPNRTCQSSKSQSQTTAGHGRKPIQKIVYHLLKDSDLRKRVKEEGLDTRGDRKTLIARHQRFAVLWNAQCQVDHPLSRMEIVMRVKKEEQTEKREQAQAQEQKSKHLDYDRNKTEQHVIEAKKQDYLKENKTQFSDLVAQIRLRRQLQKEKEKEKREQEEEDNEKELRREREPSLPNTQDLAEAGPSRLPPSPRHNTMDDDCDFKIDEDSTSSSVIYCGTSQLPLSAGQDLLADGNSGLSNGDLVRSPGNSKKGKHSKFGKPKSSRGLFKARLESEEKACEKGQSPPSEADHNLTCNTPRKSVQASAESSNESPVHSQRHPKQLEHSRPSQSLDRQGSTGSSEDMFGSSSSPPSLSLLVEPVKTNRRKSRKDSTDPSPAAKRPKKRKQNKEEEAAGCQMTLKKKSSPRLPMESSQTRSVGQKENKKTCPICQQPVPRAYIAIHVDKCLESPVVNGHKDNDNNDFKVTRQSKRTAAKRDRKKSSQVVEAKSTSWDEGDFR